MRSSQRRLVRSVHRSLRRCMDVVEAAARQCNVCRRRCSAWFLPRRRRSRCRQLHNEVEDRRSRRASLENQTSRVPVEEARAAALAAGAGAGDVDADDPVKRLPYCRIILKYSRSHAAGMLSRGEYGPGAYRRDAIPF